MSDEIEFKVTEIDRNQSTTRIISISKDDILDDSGKVKFHVLVDKIGKAFEGGPIDALYWRDREGTKITCSNNKDLAIALREMEKDGGWCKFQFDR